MLLHQALLEELAVVAVDDRLLRDSARDCIQHFVHTKHFLIHLISNDCGFHVMQNVFVRLLGSPLWLFSAGDQDPRTPLEQNIAALASSWADYSWCFDNLNAPQRHLRLSLDAVPGPPQCQPTDSTWDETAWHSLFNIRR